MRPVHGWRAATVAGTARESASARTIRLAVADWPGHVAGQHIDVRLTAEDGYQATRSFSLSSAPGEAPQIATSTPYSTEPRRWAESARQGRTWTAAALCDWLAAERGVRVSPARPTELLHRVGFRWKQTRDTLRHKADPFLQQAARAQLEDLRLYGWTRTGA